MTPCTIWRSLLVLTAMAISEVTAVCSELPSPLPSSPRQALIIDLADPAEASPLRGAATSSLERTLSQRTGCFIRRLDAVSSNLRADLRNVLKDRTLDVPAENSVLIVVSGELVSQDSGILIRAWQTSTSSPEPFDWSLTDLLQTLSGPSASRSVLSNEHLQLVIHLITDDKDSSLEAACRQIRSVVARVPHPHRTVLIGVSRRHPHARDRFLDELDSSLKGQADQDFDDQVTFAEVCSHLQSRHTDDFRTTSDSSSELESRRNVSTVRPLLLDEAIDDLAQLTARELRNAGVEYAGVPEFLIPDASLPNGASSSDAKSTTHYQPLLRYGANRFRTELSREADAAYRLFSPDWLVQLLNENQISPTNLQSDQLALLGRAFNRRLPGSRAGIIVTEVEPLSNGFVRLTTSVIDPVERLQIGSAFVRTAVLTDAERGQAGFSAITARGQEVLGNAAPSPQVAARAPMQADFRQSDSSSKSKPDSMVDKTGFTVDLSFDSDDVLKEIVRKTMEFDESAKRDHPLTDDQFPVRIALRLQQQREALPIHFSADQRDAYSPIEKGQRYVIRIENRLEHPVYLRLLVDGLNTLPEFASLAEAEADGASSYVEARPLTDRSLRPAQHVSLNRARAWRVDPGVYEVEGFYRHFRKTTGLAAQGRFNEFVVTDAGDSEAARQGFTKDIGIVTAAIYEPIRKEVMAQSAADRGTVLGAAAERKVVLDDGQYAPGELLGVVNLRYGIDP